VAVESIELSMQNEIVDKLRELAGKRASLAAMVEFVKAELGHSEVYVVPLMSYFCRAFSLPLRDVLPLREWVNSRDDDSVATLLERIDSLGNGQG
jgi:hypothetical protein